MTTAIAKHTNDIKALVATDYVKARIESVLGKRGPQFASSLISAVQSSAQLQKADPKSILASAMTAATLDLPINPNLGFAHIVPYAGKAQFQMGYKGFVQLALRTGQYKHLNAVVVREGELIKQDKLRGEATFDFDAATSDVVTGYAAYMMLVSGYEHTIYRTKADVATHAEKFSAAYRAQKKDSPWFTNFDAMALKTVVKELLTKWGMLSVEMHALQTALVEDQGMRASMDAPIEYADNPTNAPPAGPQPKDGRGKKGKPPKDDPFPAAAFDREQALNVLDMIPAGPRDRAKDALGLSDVGRTDMTDDQLKSLLEAAREA